MHSESPLLLEIENPIRHIGSWINPVMKDSEKVKPVLPRASRTCTKLVCPISESRSFVTCSTAGDDIWREKNLFSFGWIWIKFCRSDTIHPAVFPGKPGFSEGFSLLKIISQYEIHRTNILQEATRMDKKTYHTIEKYMLSFMKDAAHDPMHIYRVLYQALQIAKGYPEVNQDILIASCLLHDIGRMKQFQNPRLCHAEEGGKMAYEIMRSLGWNEKDCKHIQECITTHRFRTDRQPESIEAKILFDADKLDVTGALGISRTLLYKGQAGEPLYAVDAEKRIYDGKDRNEPESFLKEYHFKLSRLYETFYTPEAFETARRRKEITVMFYHELMDEISTDDMDQLLNLEN